MSSSKEKKGMSMQIHQTFCSNCFDADPSDVQLCGDCGNNLCSECTCRREACIQCGTKDFCCLSSHLSYGTYEYYYFCPLHKKCPVCDKNENDIYGQECYLCDKSRACCKDCAEKYPAECEIVCPPCEEVNKRRLTAKVCRAARALGDSTRTRLLRKLGFTSVEACELIHLHGLDRDLVNFPVSARWVMGLLRWKNRAMERHYQPEVDQAESTYQPGGLGWARRMENLTGDPSHVKKSLQQIESCERKKRFEAARSRLMDTFYRVRSRLERLRSETQCTILTCSSPATLGPKCVKHYKLCSKCNKNTRSRRCNQSMCGKCCPRPCRGHGEKWTPYEFPMKLRSLRG